jgi:DNA-binding NtrC family response regulator/tetratricopeptide (TPR) repeat protein
MEIQVKGLGSPINAGIEPFRSLVEEGQYDRALKEIASLEEKPGAKFSPGDQADLCYLSAVALYNLGRYKDALGKASLAFDLLKDTSENSRVAQIQDILGRIHWGLGDLRNAELHVRDAATTYRRIRDYAAIVQCGNILARILFTKADFNKAVEYLKEAKDLARSIQDQWMEAKIQGNLGRIDTLLGNWKKAEEELRISLKANEERGNAIGQCRDLLSLGYLFTLKRQFQEAEDFLSSALRLARENDYLRETVIYHEYMGGLRFDQGRYDQAEDHYSQLIDLWEKDAPDGDMISQTYRLLAEVNVAQKRLDQALLYCRKSLQVARSLGERIEHAATFRVLGQIYSGRGEKQKCRQCLQKALSLLQEIGARYELARTFLEAGRADSFDYYKRLAFLSNAESLFRQLDSRYHLGMVNLAITQLLKDESDYGKAQIFLAEAEGLFKQAGGKKELRQVQDLKYAIDEALFQSRKIAKSNGRVTFDGVITQNAEMREVIERLKQIKDYDISILVEGETGTGKDLIAKAVHYSSTRKDRRFVAINCAALPESLLENELFGHKRGAYTGADKDQPGLFEEAEGGTLYLDQVEEIPHSTQVKLLRALEEKEITRLGDTKPRKIDVRIICSSIEDLKEAVKKGRFRQDLYFRLNTFYVRLPALMQRKEDIPVLARHFLKDYGLDQKKVREFEKNGNARRLVDYHWPGNVRELENELKRMVVLAQAGGKDPGGFLSDRLGSVESDRRLSHEDGDLFHQVAEFEKHKIVEALRQSNWVKLRAARVLGIPEATIRNKIRKHRISLPISASQANE